MTNEHDERSRRSSGGNVGDVRHPSDTPAVQDAGNLETQRQVHQDRDEMQEAARRNEGQGAATDPEAAARQDQVRSDRDALQESERRVEASVDEDVRNRPIRRRD